MLRRRCGTVTWRRCGDVKRTAFWTCRQKQPKLSMPPSRSFAGRIYFDTWISFCSNKRIILTTIYFLQFQRQDHRFFASSGKPVPAQHSLQRCLWDRAAVAASRSETGPGSGAGSVGQPAGPCDGDSWSGGGDLCRVVRQRRAANAGDAYFDSGTTATF